MKQLSLYKSINVSLSERKQMMDNHYAAPYPDTICLGLGINNELRQITASRPLTLLLSVGQN